MTTATIEEVQASLPSLIAQLKPGEEVVILRTSTGGRPADRGAPPTEARRRHREADDCRRRRLAPGRLQRVHAVRFLLDTHAFLWAVLDDPTLSDRAGR